MIESTEPELSDDAALLIAGGYVDDATRRILAERRAAGRALPDVGGPAQLRHLADELTLLRRRLGSARFGPFQALLERRATLVEKRLRSRQAAFVHSPRHHASGVRAIRRDRRDGVHLDIAQREALFVALSRTPAPARNEMRDRVVTRVGALRGRAVVAGAGRRIAEALDGFTDAESLTGAGEYDALLYLTGRLFDRIDNSAVWHSDHFVVQRGQLDLADEVTQISIDAVALRSILAELAEAAAMARDEGTRAQISSRRVALSVVWDQLVERVAALARIGDLVARADDQLRSQQAAAHAASLDTRIDDLLARSGSRELSAANTHYVGDQVDGVDELMLAHRTALYGDIAVLTSGNDRRGQ